MNEILDLTTHYQSENIIDKFEQDCVRQGLVPETARHYVAQVRILDEFLNQKGLEFSQVDKFIMADFINHLRMERRVTVKTLENYLYGIKNFLEFLHYHDYHTELNYETLAYVRKRYIKRYKHDDAPTVIKLISVDEMRALVLSILNPRDRAIVLLFAKTGIRRNELIQINVEDLDLANYTITLKPQRKRSNCTAFFDYETAKVLREWLENRAELGYPNEGPLFVSKRRGRLKRQGIYHMFTKNTEKIGYHNPHSPKAEDHFFPHCCRHWFTTHLIRNGMKREHIKWLRGDSLGKEAVDIYHHIEPQDVFKEYLRTMPRLGL